MIKKINGSLPALIKVAMVIVVMIRKEYLKDRSGEYVHLQLYLYLHLSKR